MIKKFIEPEIGTKKETRASYVRKSFLINKEIQSATLEITALGTYIGYLNGERLDQQMLLPGYTDYRYRVQSNSYDVTSQLVMGENVIAALIGNGWYRGSIGAGNIKGFYGDKLKCCCVLSMKYTDGTEECIYTDKTWKASQDGPLCENDLKQLERYDGLKEKVFRGWNMPGYHDENWHGVTESDYDGKIIPQCGEPILEQERFSPQIIWTPDKNVVLDFGQNLAGHVEFTVTGKANTEVALIMGEVLDEKGNFTQKNLNIPGADNHLGQRLEYRLREGTQTYKSHFLISGYRYVLLENWPEEVKAENFTSIAIYSDLKKTGSFECSNPLVNRLVHNTRWSQQSNFVDVPTDCPTRERAGWTADISCFAETACYLSDTYLFLKKWIQDYLLEQKEDGNLPYVVPEAGYEGKNIFGCAGWSDSLIHLVMTLYQFYGKKEILKETYDAMCRFIEFNQQRALKKNPAFLFKGGTHRKYIVETGFHFGEWLEPGHSMQKDYIKAMICPDTEVTTAWFCYTTKLLSEIALILGKKADAEKYAQLSENIRQAYIKEFVKDGMVISKRQCRYVRPLYMKLLEKENEAQIAAELNAKCIQNEYKIGTGFLTTYKVLQTLSDYGYAETAYKMLENTKMPGWMYAITKGATTIWENWLGIDENNVPKDSQNHYAPGAVTAWLFSHCVGIRPQKPGFEEILIQPVPGGTFTYAKAEYKSVRGIIHSSWERKGNMFELKIDTPEDVLCKIVLPDGSEYFSQGGAKVFECKLWNNEETV